MPFVALSLQAAKRIGALLQFSGRLAQPLLRQRQCACRLRQILLFWHILPFTEAFLLGHLMSMRMQPQDSHQVHSWVSGGWPEHRDQHDMLQRTASAAAAHARHR